jgi:dynein heavy chain
MGQVHNMVTEVCEMYFTQFRRRVYVTPKSYLAFLTFYQTLYKNKLAKILMDESQINEGLAKLEQASTDINQMKKELAVKEEELKKKSEECNAAVKVITQENIKADAKAAEVSVISAACEKRAASIAIEKAMAQKDLDAAMPILEKANKAASGIKPNDITEIRANKKPIDIFKVVFDCVLIVFQKNINPITMNECTIAKKTFPWYKDSYELSI